MNKRVLLAAWLLAASPTFAGERFDAPGPNTGGASRIQPASQFAIGLGMRADRVSNSDNRPQVEIQYLRYFADPLALRASFGLTPKSWLNANTKATVYQIGAAIRLHMPTKGWGVYLEGGLDIDYYRGEFLGRSWSGTMPGAAFECGIAVGPYRDRSVDLFLAVHLAPEGSYSDGAVPAGAKPAGSSIYPSTEPHDLYNSAHLGVRYRFGF